jgi:hypothetical protein
MKLTKRNSDNFTKFSISLCSAVTTRPTAAQDEGSEQGAAHPPQPLPGPARSLSRSANALEPLCLRQVSSCPLTLVPHPDPSLPDPSSDPPPCLILSHLQASASLFRPLHGLTPGRLRSQCAHRHPSRQRPRGWASSRLVRCTWRWPCATTGGSPRARTCASTRCACARLCAFCTRRRAPQCCLILT